MTVEQFLEKHLETTIEPINVNEHITDDSIEEILESCPCVEECEDGTVYYNPKHLCAYYHMNEDPEDVFYFIDIYEEDEVFDNEDF